MAALERDAERDTHDWETISAIETPDQLTYIADMILELQQIAAKSKFDLLAGLLMCAHDEATRKLADASAIGR